ncbi:MAG TPA: MnmC family methyltransferase [Candidatus Limnocylindria bacterium]|nr:MnmC family methyltransferase [Candidatus Limnocylindria bacterium]
MQLKNGSWSVRSLAEAETFHPVVGPVAEAEALYVRQLQLVERVARQPDREFVIWDVGLGAAANVLTALKALRELPGRLRVVSFDHTLEPLRFALRHATELGYYVGYEAACEALLSDGTVTFANGANQVRWQVHTGDFPTLLGSPAAGEWPRPNAIFFDAYSPAKNMAMWTLPLFRQLHDRLDPAVPCTLATYSRATLLRVTLLLAGWYVGAGSATGEKEETTIAANALELLCAPLGQTWLARARRSTSAEPMKEAVYQQAPLSPASAMALAAHLQFR